MVKQAVLANYEALAEVVIIVGTIVLITIFFCYLIRMYPPADIYLPLSQLK